MQSHLLQSHLRFAAVALFLGMSLIAPGSAAAEQLILASVPGGVCVAGESNAVAQSTSLSCVGSNVGIRRNSDRLAAVSCASNQWCCRRDFSNNTCVRCCSK